MSVKIKKEIVSTREKKKLVLAALEKTLGNISASCDVAKISRRTFYNWIDSDPKFRAKYDALDFSDRLLDLAENRLYKEIQAGNLRAVIFYLSTKGTARGWGKTQKIDVAPIPPIVIQDVDKGFFDLDKIAR